MSHDLHSCERLTVGEGLGLYFLGHMAWAYVWAVIAWTLIPAAKRGGKLFVPAILMLGVLPDVDLLLGGLGVVHRTVRTRFSYGLSCLFHSSLFFVLKQFPILRQWCSTLPSETS